MSVQMVHPAGLPRPEAFSQVSVAAGSRTVTVAGQVPQDAEGRLVGDGDLAAQTEQVLRNVVTALQAAGATFEDVTRLGIYVVDYGASTLEQVGGGIARAGDVLGSGEPPPATLVGVAALAVPGQLIEIEASAVLG